MNGRRSFLAMIAVTSLLFLALVGSAALAYTLLQKQSQKLEASRLETKLLDEQQNALVKANKDIQKYAELEKIANTIVPQDKDQARTVREIISLAKESNIPITSITFPTSNLGQIIPKATTSTTDTSSTTPKITTPPVSQVKAVEGITGVYQMEINVQSDSTSPVPYSSLINFLSKLEHSRRTAQVSNISIIPYSKDINLVTFSLGINVFIKP